MVVEQCCTKRTCINLSNKEKDVFKCRNSRWYLFESIYDVKRRAIDEL